MITTDYARALYAAVSREPARGKEFLHNLQGSLKHRGHEKLLRRIFTEYERLEEKKIRREQAAKVTPEQEQTRILLQLYKKLVQSNAAAEPRK